ncbi:FAD-binding and (Fe-S)-binding domain-containing protein [Chitinophaga caseinilytica]|uniref:D-lactate dehydrogenase (cytochrome) n=1 Tax=Chitinophaga caseinilytica TaxID=2267521 RepID=A0ABZ2YZM8_9BACT
MEAIGRALEAILPADRIKTRLIDILSYAADAGFYHLEPKAVVQPVGEDEVKALFRFSHQHRIPLTFRAAGTSLSGQSVTDGILADLSRHWQSMKIENDGATVRVQPGITGGIVNARLRQFGKKIGPDPASINSAMMGGILSNNASGMCCGVSKNSYHTVQFIRFILPNGLTFTTENPDDYQRFREQCAELYDTLLQLRDEVRNNEQVRERIRAKYRTKNTVGYSVNALVDFDDPLDILAHLLIGAEGTLGFISEAVMRTVPDYPEKSTGLLYFPDIHTACEAIVPLTESGAEAVELMDRASLRSVEHLPGIPELVKTLPEPAAALLVEYQGNTQEELKAKKEKFLAVSGAISLIVPPSFTENPVEQAYLWKIRKGMFPSVGAVRQSGTTVILEDIAVPVARLGDAILDLQVLFGKYGYENAIIFGHAKDGNIHFVVTQAFDTPAEIQRYDGFIREVVQLIAGKYDGALKAEHGTGRNMAPFVETEWGPGIYEVMKTLKSAIDPENLLNPGVLINADKEAHIRNLKELPRVEEEVDKCMECGFCEYKCPSRELTLTPRRRIVVRRALVKLKHENRKQDYRQLLKEYQYDGLDTCAVDGLCAVACPVDINTGMLVKRLRRENHSGFANKVALQVAKNFNFVSKAVWVGLKAGSAVNAVFGDHAMTGLTKGMRKVVPAMPLWSPHLKPSSWKPSPAATVAEGDGPRVVYFPSCINRIMGGSEKGKRTSPILSLPCPAKRAFPSYNPTISVVIAADRSIPPKATAPPTRIP